MHRWTFMQSMRSIAVQIHAIDYDRRRDTCRAIPILPPAFDKLALINDLMCQTGANEREIGISIDRSNGIARSRPTHAMNPVDAVEPLDNTRSSAARLP